MHEGIIWKRAAIVSEESSRYIDNSNSYCLIILSKTHFGILKCALFLLRINFFWEV